MAKNIRLKDIEDTIQSGPFTESWDSLETYKIPEWYVDGKFGIFIHWGVYSVPAYGNEWYPRQMYQRGHDVFDHHVKTYGPQKDFGYKDFIPLFTAERFEPHEWAQLFKASGARFVVPVAEHHDGFQMYDSALSEWNAAKMGPKRDVLGELAAAVREAGMVFGASSHRAEHWWFFDGGNEFESDVSDPRFQGLYGPAQRAPIYHRDHLDNPPNNEFLEDWLLRTCEIVDKYQPQIIWFDWWIMNLAFKPYLKKFATYYYNKAAQWGKPAAINYKFDAFPPGSAVLDVERGQLSGIESLFWQTDTSVSRNSWGYIKNHDYKKPQDILCDLVDIVSKNGALLLNIGPRPDGTIPELEKEMLRHIGAWLAVNGEAIYESRPYSVFGEGPTEVAEGAFTDTIRPEFTSEDIRFTRNHNNLYATVLRWPEDGRVMIKSLAKDGRCSLPAIDSIDVLGNNASLTWSCQEHGLQIITQGVTSTSDPVVLRIRTKGD